MKNLIRFYTAILFVSLFIFSCNSKNIRTSTPTAETVGVEFLDSLSAAKHVLIDDSFNIFDRLTKLDMCIQMKQKCRADESRADLMKRYTAYLQNDVTNFTDSEINWLGDIWQEAVDLCNNLNKAILPSEIKLIKSRGSYYGGDAFYTRENCIVIPSERIEVRNREAMLSVILHEIFHIYSRLNPEKQKNLYQLIGFENIGDSKDLIISSPLKEQLLTNPDGPNFAYAINLESKERKLKCVPIISATLPNFTKEKKVFFDYLYFDLFEVVQNEDKAWEVLSDKDGKAQVPDDAMPSFFEQIKYNTQYIIHPDEILADNFMILAMIDKYPDRYQPDEVGLQLLEKIKNAL